jgi:protein-tyrosine phosphatase
MVDIHSHFLYGLDDGAQDRDTSIAMLRMAFDNGTTDIVATPHSDLTYSFQPESILAQLHDLGALEGVPRLHRGCDFHLSFDNIQDCHQHPFKYTVSGKRYLLVEFDNRMVPANIGEVFRRMAEDGITPIITHPERNPLLRKRLPDLALWVQSGCAIQVTAQSLLGGFGQSAEQFAHDLLARGLVHFLASDAHDLHRRPPTLRDAFERVKAQYGLGLAELLLTGNPGAVLTGEPIQAPPTTKNARRWFKLW